MKKIFVCFLFIISIFTMSFSTGNDAILAESNKSLEITSKSALLMDYNTKTILFEKDSDKKLPIASMVKLMTTLLTLERIDNGQLKVDDSYSISEKAAGMGGSQVFLDAYSEYKLGDLLKSVIVCSANDSAVAISEIIAGSQEEFVTLMNKRAKELGMNNTNYVNATGLPMAGQYSTAKDVAILTCEVLKHPLYFNYSKTWLDKFVHPSGRETEMTNTNKLVRFYKDCDGGKTGYTDEAGHCLSATAKRNDLRLISVIIGGKDSKSRFSEVSSMLNYGFANFKNECIIDNNKILDIKGIVKGSSVNEIELIPNESYYNLISKSNKDEIKINYVVNELKAPINKGDVVGKIIITKNNEVIKEIDILANQSASKKSYKDSLQSIVKNWAI